MLAQLTAREPIQEQRVEQLTMAQKQWKSKRPGETRSIFKLAQSELTEIEVEVLHTLATQLEQELTSIDMAGKEKRLRVKVARKEYIIASMDKQQRQADRPTFGGYAESSDVASEGGFATIKS